MATTSSFGTCQKNDENARKSWCTTTMLIVRALLSTLRIFISATCCRIYMNPWGQMATRTGSVGNIKGVLKKNSPPVPKIACGTFTPLELVATLQKNKKGQFYARQTQDTRAGRPL